MKNLVWYVILISEIILIIIFTTSLFFYNKTSNKIPTTPVLKIQEFYRLGDMILYLSERKKIDGYKYHKQKFPDSIATEYMNKTKKNHDLNTLTKIIKRRIDTKNLRLPSSDTLVVHLRTGDVIDFNSYSVEEFLTSPKLHSNGSYYVKCLKYYEKVIKKVKKQNPEIKNVMFFSGFHTNGNHDKSLQYIQSICDFFEKNGYLAEKRINEDPDEDFIFMSQSKYFVKSGGGFSALIADLVKKNNGKVFGE